MTYLPRLGRKKALANYNKSIMGACGDTCEGRVLQSLLTGTDRSFNEGFNPSVMFRFLPAELVDQHW